jgi:L-threonylcarbamoyladenylate synthase
VGAPLSIVDEAVAALAHGGVVVVPTDTVYGLAAGADRPEAVERIFELKVRPSEKAVQVLVPGEEWLERLGRPTAYARRLAHRYWPGPLTLIVNASSAAPTAVTSGGTIGLRVPAHPLALKILDRAGAIAATSANRTGEQTPDDISTIRALFGDDVDVYVDGGRIAGVASTVVDTTGPSPVVVREGVVPAEEILRAHERGFEAG